MKHWLAPRIDDVVLRGLAKTPNDRYQTAAEFFSSRVYELMEECVKAFKDGKEGSSKAPPTPAEERNFLPRVVKTARRLRIERIFCLHSRDGVHYLFGCVSL